MGKNLAMGSTIFRFLPYCTASLRHKFNGVERLAQPGKFRPFQEKEILAYLEAL